LDTDYGIEPEYIDTWGRKHVPSDKTRRLIRAALGATETTGPLDPTFVVRDDAEFIPLRAPAEHANSSIKLEIRWEKRRADRVHSKAGDIERGDMITFLYPRDTRQTFVKRVIGLPGGPHSNCRQAGDPQRTPLSRTEVIVPADSFYVLGDNRDISWDSRDWGFVPRTDVVGKPWIVFWSYDAPTNELAGWNRAHFADLSRHFFTKTRGERTLLVLHSQPAQEVKP
jgi:hypothetical protein